MRFQLLLFYYKKKLKVYEEMFRDVVKNRVEKNGLTKESPLTISEIH